MNKLYTAVQSSKINITYSLSLDLSVYVYVCVCVCLSIDTHGIQLTRTRVFRSNHS